MSAPKPTKYAVSSAKEFKTLCITASKTYKIRKRRVGLEDVREWLAPPAPVDDEDSSEEEWSADDNLKGDPVHYIRKIVNWEREKKITYYLVDWEPTWEPKEHLNQKAVATFEKERRLLVKKTFFEDEAVGDSTLNKTE
ncbi:hypothetical protein PR003_g19899 [Phytophthora rubi]|uniref:Chromo domain-containing protein n=1 Tax=Phytophthora rubi TaxID=129364 RepID=A0A6A4E1C6_9STRA|nr:hypothetical protein PR003_g19899 [Phytophthora rubi]